MNYARLIACSIVLIFSGHSAVNAEAFGHHPATSLHLGSSFDPVDLSRAYGNCIAFDAEVSLDKPRKADGTRVRGHENDQLFATETQFNIDILQSKRDFYRYLHISAAVSGHYKLFSGGASFEQEEEDTYNSDSFSWIVRATTDYGRFGMLNPKLTPEASALRTNLAALRDRCGFEYISQVNRSVLAAIVYRIKNVSESSKKRIEASFNASIGGGLWGLEAEASYKSLVKEAISQGTLELKVYLIGGDGMTTISEIAVDPSNVKEVKRILIDYTKRMGPSKAVPTTYVSGSLSAFVPELANIDYSFYFKTLDDIFFLRSELVGRSKRVQRYLLDFKDYNGEQPSDDIRVHPNWLRWSKNLNRIQASIDEIVDTAATCRSAYHLLSSISIDCSGPTKRRVVDIIERVSRSGPQQAVSAQAANARLRMLTTGVDSEDAAGEVNRRVEASKAIIKAGAVANKCDVSKGLEEIVSNSCSIGTGWLRSALADLPPSIPFAINFSTSDRQDAGGNVIRSVVTFARGATVQRVYLEDAKGKTLQIGEAQGTGETRAATAVSDISSFAADQFPLVLKAEAISGKIYPTFIPLKN